MYSGFIWLLHYEHCEEDTENLEKCYIALFHTGTLPPCGRTKCTESRKGKMV